ncbi:sensor histidine kinase [Sporosarcina saromensis]|uniref:Sensor histidine kinase n=1 Tax=Sporosarcina saromensis TaxID=359365 RepID=A0ABU4GAZ9_9BACL|nr:sensor histidine kinase [Sporosarcina saromensis]MDW0114155.1 sensor histidine kinase [Sporosarcina saromensis]
MKNLVGRSFSLSLLFLAITAIYFYALIDVPIEESWVLFYDIQYANVPLGAWILITCISLGTGIAFWMSGISRSKDKVFVQKLTGLIQNEELVKTKRFSPKIERRLVDVSNILATQRKSLQRITDERAEAQDKMIQERIVQERQRLARELHDSVSQQLFAASMLLSAITESNEDDAALQKPLLQVERMVQQAQLEMRALLLHLRPAALNDKSLAQGLEELLVELKEKVMFDIRYRLEEVSLSKGAEDHLFRIAQETLSNTLRHAQATEVDILFVERDGLCIFRVQDNGVGFKDTDGKGGSYGLQNVKERAIEIGGTCKIVSVPSQGTIVEVKLPTKKGDELDDSSSFSG